uniref:Uncharacterized protein n=1 Tax=Arundo donax TaxID=35708 RepID=A0A0A9FR39_ARUDO
MIIFHYHQSILGGSLQHYCFPAKNSKPIHFIGAAAHGLATAPASTASGEREAARGGRSRGNAAPVAAATVRIATPGNESRDWIDG